MNQAVQYKICKYLHKVKIAQTDIEKNKYQKKLNKYIQRGGFINVPKTEIIQKLTKQQYELKKINSKLNKYQNKITNLSGGSKKDYYVSKVQHYISYGGNLKQELEKIKAQLAKTNSTINSSVLSVGNKIGDLKQNPTKVEEIGKNNIEALIENADFKINNNKVDNEYKLLIGQINEYNKYYQLMNEKIDIAKKKINNILKDNINKTNELNDKYGIFYRVSGVNNPRAETIEQLIKMNNDKLSNELRKIVTKLDQYNKTKIIN